LLGFLFEEYPLVFEAIIILAIVIIRPRLYCN
jgi:hypothetical protein